MCTYKLTLFSRKCTNSAIFDKNRWASGAPLHRSYAISRIVGPKNRHIDVAPHHPIDGTQTGFKWLDDQMIRWPDEHGSLAMYQKNKEVSGEEAKSCKILCHCKD